MRRLLPPIWLCCLLLAAPTVFAAEPPAFTTGKWPFCPPVRPAVPQGSFSTWAANPIDAFIGKALFDKGIEPTEAADKRTLLRRVTFDLTGLPPTPEEQAAFLADTSTDAYARAVDRLLESPRYGERWAQHWLDLVRYAETDGFKEDALRPNAHKFRDYVIRAFNADLPYDRFIAQQLAGDELEPDNTEAWLATGLNRLYPDETNAANVRQRRQEIHDEITDNTSLIFLGLTVGCAQCHDHKFDPITQIDYFRLQAFFAPLLARDDVPLASAQEQRRHQIAQAAWDEATGTIRRELDELLEPKRTAVFQDAIEKFEPEIRESLQKPLEQQTCMERQLAVQAMKYVAPKMVDPGKTLKGDKKERYETLKKQLADYAHLKPEPLPTAMAASDAMADAPPTYRLRLGDYRQPQEEVQPGFPAFLGTAEAEISATANTTGRRAALVRWLCRDDHPLTARVMVNRLWLHHFGAGIVATPNDFGAMGEPPSHPELLDWLAVEFVESGWSIKHMHRLMVFSATYRQASQVDLDRPQHAKALELDRGNRLLWHARRRRLEGEAIRDAMLQLAGTLEFRMFGESARPELPDGIDKRYAWKPDAELANRNRRSLYVLAKRNLRYPLFDVFDQPDLHNSCPERSTTTTAPQALALLNGDFTIEQARRWSERLLLQHCADSDARVDAAFTQGFGRPPRPDERELARKFFENRAAADAWADLCHALLNANEFLYVD